PRPPRPTPSPYTTLFRSRAAISVLALEPACRRFLRLSHPQSVEETRIDHEAVAVISRIGDPECGRILAVRADDRNHRQPVFVDEDRKSTRLNSSHLGISY